MKVFGRCPKCQSEIPFKTQAHTRVEFAMQDGENINLTCENCGAHNNFHVDELFANPSKIAQLVASLAFLIGIPLSFFFVNPIFEVNRSNYSIYVIGGLLLVPVFVYIIINKQDQTRVSDFNRRKLKGRIHNI